MFFLFFIGFIVFIAMIVLAIKLDNKKKLEIKTKADTKFAEIISQNNISVSKSIEIKAYQNNFEANHFYGKFLVDDNNKTFSILNYNLILDKVDFKNVKYSDLINFNLFEDGEQQIQGKGMMAAGGALLFGVAGAVVGSVAGGSKIKNKCSELSVRIQINDLQNPLLSITTLTNTNKNSIYYKLAKQTADEIIATLTYIENNK